MYKLNMLVERMRVGSFEVAFVAFELLLWLLVIMVAMHAHVLFIVRALCKFLITNFTTKPLNPKVNVLNVSVNCIRSLGLTWLTWDVATERTRRQIFVFRLLLRHRRAIVAILLFFVFKNLFASLTSEGKFSMFVFYVL